MNDAQIAFLVLYVIYSILILLFQDTFLLYPFRLLTTFLHELCHALACWISCGRVHSIRVYDNEGGVTSYAGGCRTLIVPAGYVGAAMWGMALVMTSGGQKTSTTAAGVLIGTLLISLCYAPNRTMILLNLAYVIITSVFIYLEWKVYSPILNYIVLFYGTFVGIHALFDTYRDTVRRTVLRSDAYACYEMYPCCLPKFVGLQWAILNIVSQLLGIWIAMMQLSDACVDLGWWECIGVDGNGDGNWEFGDKLWEWEERVVGDIEEYVHR